MTREEALSEPSSDLISRADAIGAVDSIKSTDNWQGAVIALLSALPSAEAVMRDATTEERASVQRYIDSISTKVVQGDGRNNIKRYPNCQMRTSLGNCDAIGGFCTSVNEAICDAFHKLADVDWIPITTSEPTTAHRVLVTYNWGDDDYDDYEVSDLDYWVAKCAAEEGNKQCQMFIDHVIAWMPLPKPYKGGDSK